MYNDSNDYNVNSFKALDESVSVNRSKVTKIRTLREQYKRTVISSTEDPRD